MKTADGVSPGVSATDVLISLIAFTLIYGVLLVVEMKLLIKAAQTGPEEITARKNDDQLVVAY
jgi:cytochrome d ubiquinol oxidase subunit I